MVALEMLVALLPSPYTCRFLMTSYLRLRLSKIQSQVWTLGSWTLDTWAFDTDLLSREELTFAKSYREEASTCDIQAC